MNVEFFSAKSEALPILSAQLRFSVASLRSPRKANQISLFGMRLKNILLDEPFQ
jgi:hypothetical protein